MITINKSLGKCLMRAIFTFLFCFLLIQSAESQSNILINLADANALPATNRTVTLQALTPFSGAVQFMYSDANGCILTNLKYDTLYNGAIKSPPQQILFQLYIPSGSIGAQSWTNYWALGNNAVATYPAGATAWSIASSDARYARSGSSLSNNFYLNSNPSNYFSGQAVTNAINSLSSTNVSSVTNGFTSLVFTNPSAVLFTNILPSLTNGFQRAADVGAQITAANLVTNGSSGNSLGSSTLFGINVVSNITAAAATPNGNDIKIKGGQGLDSNGNGGTITVEGGAAQGGGAGGGINIIEGTYDSLGGGVPFPINIGRNTNSVVGIPAIVTATNNKSVYYGTFHGQADSATNASVATNSPLGAFGVFAVTTLPTNSFYPNSNPSNFITTASTNDFATKSFVTNQTAAATNPIPAEITNIFNALIIAPTNDFVTKQFTTNLANYAIALSGAINTNQIWTTNGNTSENGLSIWNGIGAWTNQNGSAYITNSGNGANGRIVVSGTINHFSPYIVGSSWTATNSATGNPITYFLFQQFDTNGAGALAALNATNAMGIGSGLMAFESSNKWATLVSATNIATVTLSNAIANLNGIGTNTFLVTSTNGTMQVTNLTALKATFRGDVDFTGSSISNLNYILFNSGNPNGTVIAPQNGSNTINAADAFSLILWGKNNSFQSQAIVGRQPIYDSIIYGGAWNSVIVDGFSSVPIAYDFIFGATNNITDANYNFIFGFNNSSTLDNVTMFSDSEPSIFSAAKTNTWIARYKNGFGFNTNSPGIYTAQFGTTNGVNSVGGFYDNGTRLINGGASTNGFTSIVFSNPATFFLSTNGAAANPTFITNVNLETLTADSRYTNFVYVQSALVGNGYYQWVTAFGAYTNVYFSGYTLVQSAGQWFFQSNGVSIYSRTGAIPVGNDYTAIPPGSTPTPNASWAYLERGIVYTTGSQTNPLQSGAFTVVGNAAVASTNTMKVYAATNADYATYAQYATNFVGSGNVLTNNQTTTAGAQTAVSNNITIGSLSINGAVITNQVNTSINPTLVWCPNFNTNVIVIWGVPIASYNTNFYWNSTLKYWDSNGDPFTGGYTNKSGNFIIRDSVYSLCLTTDTNLFDFLIDYQIASSPSNIVSVLNFSDFQPSGGLAEFLTNSAFGVLAVNQSKISGNFVATNGTALIPCYSQQAPTWMWNAYGWAQQNGQTATVLSNHVVYFKSIGLDPYLDGYMLDNGIWNGPQDSSGNLSYITNNWSLLGGLNGAYKWIKTNTYSGTFILWAQCGSGNPFVGNPTLVDITNIVSNSDGCSIDASALNITNDSPYEAFEREVFNFRNVASAFGKPFPLTCNLSQFVPGQSWQPTQINVDELFLYIPDDINTWGKFVTSIHTARPYLKYLHQGQYVKFPDVTMATINTNSTQAVMIMYQCILPACGFWGEPNDTNILGSVLNVVTNSDVRTIFKDPLLAKGFLVNSNGQDELWVRKLSGNSCVAAFWNTSSSKSNLTSLTFRALDAGYDKGQSFNAKRLFFNTNFTFTDSFTVSSIGTNCVQGFLITPILNQIAQTNIVGTTATGQLPVIINGNTYYIDLKQ